MMTFHIGQGTEIYWRDNGIGPTEAEFKEIAIAKTSSFVMLTARLMKLFSKNTKNFDEFSLLLGYYMQVKNDCCNLMCTKVTASLWIAQCVIDPKCFALNVFLVVFIVFGETNVLRGLYRGEI